MRYTHVDLARGLSALAVLVCHYRWLFSQSLADWRLDAPLPLYSILWPLYEHGGLAVQMFWIISGFVFAIAYGSRDISAGDFAVHRAARLYPLHFVTLLAITALEFASLSIHGRLTIEPNFTPGFFALHLFMASNWFTMAPSFNGPIWSVSIEILIYFVFLAYWKKAGMKLLPALVLSALGFGIEVVSDSYLAMCLCLFFAGVAIALVAPRIQSRLGGRFVALSGFGFVVMLCGAAALATMGRSNWIHTYLIYIGAPAALALLVSLDLNRQAVRWEWVGAITYAVYLLHMPVIIATKIFWPGVAVYLPSPWMLAAYCLAIIGLSVPVYYGFELPAQRWVKRRGSAWLNTFRSPQAATFSSSPR